MISMVFQEYPRHPSISPSLFQMNNWDWRSWVWYIRIRHVVKVQTHLSRLFRISSWKCRWYLFLCIPYCVLQHLLLHHITVVISRLSRFKSIWHCRVNEYHFGKICILLSSLYRDLLSFHVTDTLHWSFCTSVSTSTPSFVLAKSSSSRRYYICTVSTRTSAIIIQITSMKWSLTTFLKKSSTSISTTISTT